MNTEILHTNSNENDQLEQRSAARAVPAKSLFDLWRHLPEESDVYWSRVGRVKCLYQRQQMLKSVESHLKLYSL